MIRNFTGLDVAVQDSSDPSEYHIFKSEGRADVVPIISTIGDEPVIVEKVLGYDVKGLPDPEPGVFLIVSWRVKSHLMGKRKDLVELPDQEVFSAPQAGAKVIGMPLYSKLCS